MSSLTYSSDLASITTAERKKMMDSKNRAMVAMPALVAQTFFYVSLFRLSGNTLSILSSACFIFKVIISNLNEALLT